jgi:hypothetical protein
MSEGQAVRKRRIFDDETEVEIAERYEAGERVDDLAVAYRSNATTIRRVCDRQWAEKRRPGRPAAFEPDAHECHDIIARHRAQESLRSIAGSYGVDAGSVRYRLVRWGMLIPRYRVGERAAENTETVAA